jgi:hypothetical protein
MSNCFGLCTPESSRQPRKGYNQLVTAVFPKESPSWHAPLDLVTVRKTANVQEYAQENVQQCAKISRRLSRRILKEARSSDGLGHCKVSA